MENKPCPRCGSDLYPESYPGPDGKLIEKEVCMTCQFGIPKGDDPHGKSIPNTLQR